MRFLNPAIWPIFSVIAIVVLFYFLKLRRESQIVPSLFFWHKLVEDRQANTLFQRLRRDLLLILQLIFLILLCFALLRPYIEGFIKPGSLYLVLFDTSASMTVKEKEGTRLDIAKKEGLKLVDNLKSGDRMLIATCSNKLLSISGLMSDKQKLRSFIRSIKASTSPTDLTPGLSLLSASTKGSSNAFLFILSDGQTPPPDKGFVFPGKIYFKKIGKEVDNTGISGFSIKRIDRDNKTSLYAFLEVKNFGLTAVDLNVAQIADGKQVDIIPYSLLQGESKSRILLLDPSWERISFKILREDAYGEDNQVYAALKARDKKNVSLFSSNPHFFGSLLISYPGINAKFYSPVSPEFNFKKIPSDLIILDDVAVKDIPPVNCFFIGSSPASSIKKSPEKVYQVSDWDTKHPLNQYVAWSEALFSSFNIDTRLPDWGVPLVEIGENPIVWSGEYKGIKYLSWEFSLSESDLPLHSAFVFAVANALDWFFQSPLYPYLNPAKDYTVPDTPLFKDAVLKGNGVTEKIVIGSLLPINDTGFYYIEGKEGNRASIAVSFISTSESTINPIDMQGLKAREGKEIDKKITSESEWWPYIALLSLLLLLIEWFVSYRWQMPRKLLKRIGLIS